MAAPQVQQFLAAAIVGASQSHTTAASTAVGDLLVCFHLTDFDTLAGMVAPTGTAGTWTLAQEQKESHEFGDVNLKLWTRPVTDTGAQTVTTNAQSTAPSNYNYLYVVRGDDPIVDVSQAKFEDADTVTHEAPSITTTVSETLLLAAVIANCNGGEGNINYTSVSGGSMTLDIELDGSDFSTARSAREVRNAIGATGDRVFTASFARGYVGAMLAIRNSTVSTTASLLPFFT